ncbi:MAG: TolC family protein [Deltaproteobacteria bacterium]
MRFTSSIPIVVALCCLGGSAYADDTSDTMTFRLSETSTLALTETATGKWDLESMVHEALARSWQIDVAKAQIEQAEALYSFAASQAYPRMTLNSLFGGPTPEARTVVTNDPSTATPASLEGDFDFGELGVGFRVNGEAFLPLYTFGKISKGKEAASHVVRAAGHQRTVTEAEVVVNVTRAFWAYQLTRTFLNSLDDGRGTLENVLEKIEELLDNDSPQVTENDRLRLKYALSTLLVRETEAKQAREIALRALRLLMGWDQSRRLEVADAELADLPDKIPSLFEATESAQGGRPELLALREIVKATEAFAELRRRQFYPDIYLGGVLQWAYTSNATNQTNPFVNDPFNFFNLAAGLGVRIELDVFQKLALLEQAEAEAKVRIAQTRLAEQAVELDVQRIHIEISGGYDRIAKLERANRTARGWLTASSLAYDIGTGAADELIDAFLAWAASEADLQRTRFDTLIRLTELSRATGRLVQARSGGE